MSQSSSVLLNINNAYVCLIKYFIVLLTKFSNGEAYRRWDFVGSLTIGCHDVNTVSAMLKNYMYVKRLTIEPSSQSVKISIPKNELTLYPKLFFKSINDNGLQAKEDKSTITKISKYTEKYKSDIYATTNLGCAFFLLFYTEYMQENNIYKVFEELITYDEATKASKFKYHTFQLYNFVDFNVKKHLSFRFLLSDYRSIDIIEGIVIALNSYLLLLSQEDLIKFIIVPAINAICFLFANKNKVYKTFLQKYLTKINTEVIKIIFENKTSIDIMVNHVLAEIVLDEILEYAYQHLGINSHNKYANKDSYIIEHSNIEDIWPLIAPLITRQHLDLVSSVVYFTLNNKISKIKNFLHEIYGQPTLDLKHITSKYLKRDIYEIIYLKYTGYFELKKLTNIDAVSFCYAAIKNNGDIFQHIWKEYSNIFSSNTMDRAVTKLTLEKYFNGLIPKIMSREYIKDILDYDLFKTLGLTKIQMESLKKMIDKNKFILSLEQGMGKTRTIISEIIYLFNKGQFKNFIILMPATYIPIWEAEIEKIKTIISVEHIPHIHLISLEKYRLRTSLELVNTYLQLDVNDIESVSKLGKTYLCIDESVVIKNDNSKNYSCCKSLANLLEILDILIPSFEYKIRMTTGAIQSENINDWDYIGKFIFNLKEGAINLELILNGLIKPAMISDAHEFVYELNKFRAMQDNVIIKKRAADRSVTINKQQIPITFWVKNPLKNAMYYFTYLKYELYRYLHNISKIIGKTLPKYHEDQEKTFMNLRKAVISNQICGLAKDVYTCTKSKLTEQKVAHASILEYKTIKTHFLWYLKEFAEQVMPFKMFNFFYNLDAGVIGGKFIAQALVQYCIFAAAQRANLNESESNNEIESEIIANSGPDKKKTKSKAKLKTIEELETEELKEAHSKIDYQNIDKLVDIGQKIISKLKPITPQWIESMGYEIKNNSIVSQITTIFASDPNQANIDTAIALFKSASMKIKTILTSINCVYLFQVDYVFKLHNIDINTLNYEPLIEQIVDQINKNNIKNLSEYYTYLHNSNEYEEMLNTLEIHMTDNIKHGLVYYEKKFKHVLNTLLQEFEAGRTALIFFELKSHINLFNDYLAKHLPANKYIVDILDAQDKNREEIINKFSRREIHALSTTYSLTARGFNFNNTDTIIFFMPTSKYDLYNQAKYRNNRCDNKINLIHHIDYVYDELSINNKIYRLYIKKEVTKNLMENIISIQPSSFDEMMLKLSKNPKKRFDEIYKICSNNINSNEINKAEFISGLEDIDKTLEESRV